jgi:hypothetical protein
MGPVEVKSGADLSQDHQAAVSPGRAQAGQVWRRELGRPAGAIWSPPPAGAAAQPGRWYPSAVTAPHSGQTMPAQHAGSPPSSSGARAPTVSGTEGA